MRLRFPSWSVSCLILVLFALLSGLNETLRGGFMNAYCSTPRLTGWIFPTISSIRNGAYYAVIALLAAVVNQFWSISLKFTVATLSAVLLSFIIVPGLGRATAGVMNYFVHLAPSGGWCKLPYRVYVLLPAWLTFIEPVLACLFCVAFAWMHIAELRTTKNFLFMVMVLALKKQLLMAFFYASFAPVPFWTGLLSMGQFTLEAALLGLLTACSWFYAKNNRQ